MSSSSSPSCLTSRRSIEVDFDSHKFSVEMACEIINILPVRWRWWWSCIAHNSRNNSHLTERYLICVLCWVEIFVDISFDRLASGVVVVLVEIEVLTFRSIRLELRVALGKSTTVAVAHKRCEWRQRTVNKMYPEVVNIAVHTMTHPRVIRVKSEAPTQLRVRTSLRQQQ